MKKVIWIVHQYASTPESGMGGRHYYLGRELAKQGYEVYLIAATNHHLLRKTPKMDDSIKVDTISDGFNFVWVDMPKYAEAHSKQRALNWFLFPWRIQQLFKKLKSKPDVILSSSPSPIAFLGAQRLAKKYKAKLFFEVRDIWPLTLTEIGGYSPRHPFIKFMQWVEDKAYRDSDGVISNLKNSVDHMVSRGMERDKFSWVPNGFSLDEVSLKAPLSNDVLKQIPKDKFIVGYTGTIGVANALDSLIESAEQLKNNTDIAFLLVGGGKEKDNIKSLVVKKGLTNVRFIDPIPKVQIQSMLGNFDVCYIGWLKNDLYRYGIGANKIPEYLYSGKPILHAYSGGGDPILEAGAGVQVPAGNVELLSEAILKMYDISKEDLENMGKNGHRVAINQYGYDKLATGLAKIFFK